MPLPHLVRPVSSDQGSEAVTFGAVPEDRPDLLDDEVGLSLDLQEGHGKLIKAQPEHRLLLADCIVVHKTSNVVSPIWGDSSSPDHRCRITARTQL